ncbi:hypothetical protein BGX28_006599 [Mortierella sp. GBA30]|nr:hypothetical protein BGX28_006599 [Mortierella sp. GBA30]
MASPTNTSPTERIPPLAITACETYEGQFLALQLADLLEKGHKYAVKDTEDDKDKTPPAAPQLLCLARDLDKTELLQKRTSCKVVQITHDDRNTIMIALRGVHTVILIPEFEPMRVDWANQMVDVMNEEKIVRCIIISSIGTDATEKDELNRFTRVEDKVKSTIHRWTILRGGFSFQTLLYWIPMIQNQGVLGMPIRQEIEFAPLDITDLGHALIAVTFPSLKTDIDHHDGKDDILFISSESDHQQSLALNDGTERHDGQIYTLTGPKTITGPKLVEELNRALEAIHERDTEQRQRAENHDHVPLKPILYKQLTEEEVRKYLLTLRNMTPSTRLSKCAPWSSSSTTTFPSKASLSPLGFIRGTLGWVQQATDVVFKSQSSNRSNSDVVSPCSPLLEDEDEQFEHVDEGTKIIGKEPPNDPCEPPKEPEEPGKKPPNEPLPPTRPKEPKKPKGPKLEAPNDTEVELIMELLKYIDENRATFQSGDLEKITGSRGADASAFFKEHAREFRAHDSIDADSRSGTLNSWACETTLRVLNTKIVGIPRPKVANGEGRHRTPHAEASACQRKDLQRRVYERLSRFINLEELCLGHDASTSDHPIPSGDGEEHNDFQYKCLEIILESGLDQLKNLRNLRVLNVRWMEQRIGVEEVQWMTLHSPRLRQIRGLCNSRSNLKAMEWLQENTPMVKAQVEYSDYRNFLELIKIQEMRKRTGYPVRLSG